MTKNPKDWYNIIVPIKQEMPCLIIDIGPPDLYIKITCNKLYYYSKTNMARKFFITH
jgi:hypothetical protein